MRKNVKRLAIVGLIFISLGVTSVVFTDYLNKFSNTTTITTICVLFALGVIFLSISTNLIGKGDHLILNDLIPGKEYILIDHIKVNEKKTFSLVGTLDSEKYITVYGDDKLYALGPKQSFIIVRNEVRKLC